MAEMEIDRNDKVMMLDGTEIGKVQHVIIDGPSRQVTDLVVAKDGEEFLVPIGAVERQGRGMLVMRAAPGEPAGQRRFERTGYHEVDDGAINETPMRAAAGGETLTHASGDSAVIEDTRTAATMPATERPRPVREETTRATETGDTINVPIVEEKLTAGVREREAGRFRLVKSVREEEQTLDVPVQRQEVYITQTAVNRRAATEADMNMLDRDIEVPMTEQEVVTQKVARVTGEVNVHKDVVTENERVTDTVRREQVHVEGVEGTKDRVHIENERKPKK